MSKAASSAPHLTLTDFIDVVLKSGTPKATAIANIKNREDYSPTQDFYKPFREGVAEIHQKGQPKSELKALLATLRDEKKQANYPSAVQGYSKWWGKRDLTWFEPPSGKFEHDGVVLKVTPELGLSIDGTLFVIKLHLKTDTLALNRAEIINHALETTLRPEVKPGTLFGVLDVRRARLQLPSGKTPAATLEGLLKAELAYVATLWPLL